MKNLFKVNKLKITILLITLLTPPILFFIRFTTNLQSSSLFNHVWRFFDRFLHWPLRLTDFRLSSFFLGGFKLSSFLFDLIWIIFLVIFLDWFIRFIDRYLFNKSKTPWLTFIILFLLVSTGFFLFTSRYTYGCEISEHPKDKDNCYDSLARQELDINICEEITSQTQKEYCLSNIAQELKDDSICSEITKDIVKDSCFRLIAEDTENSLLCNKVVNTSTREICTINVAGLNGDLSLCGSILTDHKKEECISAVAVAREDPELCELIIPIRNYTPRRDSCISSIGINTLNPDLCKEIDFINTKGFCYFQIVRQTKDFSLCSKIEYQPELERCKNLANLG